MLAVCHGDAQGVVQQRDYWSIPLGGTDPAFVEDGVLVGMADAKLLFAFDEYCCFVAFYVPEDISAEDCLGASSKVITKPSARSLVLTTAGHSAIELATSSAEMPY